MIAALLWSGEKKAQVGSYTFSQAFSTYTSANNGTIIGASFQDDDVNPVSLPFNFTFNGAIYNTVNVCSNGYLSFESITGTEYSALSDMTTTNVIAPFAEDLFMGSVRLGDLSSGSNTITNVSSTAGLNVGDSIHNFSMDFATTPVITAIVGNMIIVNTNALNNVTPYAIFVANGSIVQSVSGVSPSRVCEIEYNNMTRFAIFNEIMNFKVRLHESTNIIEFVYGKMTADTLNVPAEVGLKGMSGLDFNSRVILSPSTWSTSAASTVVSDACDFSSLNFPVTGLTYVWTPGACTAPSITVSQSAPSVCAGMTTTLTAAGATTFSWSTGATTSQIVDSPSVTTTYTVMAFDGSCVTETTITQFVDPLPEISVTQSGNNLCSGQSATLTATGATSYSWSTGAADSSIVVSPDITTIYTVTAFDGTCENSIYVIQNVIPTPTVNILQSHNAICSGGTATLTASGAFSYTWSDNSNSPSIVISPMATTIYTLFASDSACVATKTIAQLVTAPPVLTIQSKTIVCKGQSSTLTVSGADTYTWSNGTFSNSIVVKLNSATAYTVTGIKDGCSANKTISLTVSNCTSIEESEKSGIQLSVYPNPFGDNLTVKGSNSPEMVITISNSLGGVVYKGILEEGSPETISTDQLAPGIYIVSVSDKYSTVTRKIIKK